MFKLQKSKFRHVFGYPARKERCFEGIRIARTAHEPSLCAVNRWFLATAVESSGGGSFIVMPIKKCGRVSNGHPKVCGHSGPITDLKWDPFDPWTIASGSEDCTVKVWRLPPNGLQIDLSQCWRELQGHGKRIALIEWHPTVKDVLLSASADLKCLLWNVESISILQTISVHSDVILSISWNSTGSLFASTCRDRRIRIIDPRKGTVVSEAEGHDDSKPSRVVFLKDRNLLFTSGFSRGCQRQIAIWNASDLSRPLHVEDVDTSSGILIPFYDPDSNVVYIAGKGDGNIRYYEIISQEPYISYLSQYQSNSPQCGLGMMPKWGVDPYKFELVRFYKLHTMRDLCEPISMIAPRKSEGFQEDIFPPTASPEPVLSVKEWLLGRDDEPKKISMKDIENTLANIFPTVHDLSDSHDISRKSRLEDHENIDGRDSLRIIRTKNTTNQLEPKEEQECFQAGKVRQSIGLFESDQLKPEHHPAVTGFVANLQPKQPSSTVADSAELKTSSYHLKMALPNGTTIPDAEHDLNNRTASGGFLKRSDSIDRHNATFGRTVILRQPTTTTTTQSSPSSSASPKPLILPSTNRNRTSSENARTESAHPTEPDHWNHSRADGKEPELVGLSNGKVRDSEFPWRKAMSRSKSEILPNHFRTSASVFGSHPHWADEDDADDIYEPGMIDFISVEAPDDTLIKPSILRSSMRSRRKSRDEQDSATNSGLYRRSKSFREPRTSTFQRQLPKHVDTTQITSTPVNSRQFQSDLLSHSHENFSEGRSFENSLHSEPKTRSTDQIVEGVGRPKRTSMRQWRQKYQTPSGIDGIDSRGSTPVLPKSQENVVITTVNDRTPTNVLRTHGSTTIDETEWGHRFTGRDVVDEKNKSRNRKYPGDTATNGEFMGRKDEFRRSFDEELSPPIKYDELMSLYHDKVDEVRRLREAVSSRDKKIEQLDKQMRTLMRHNSTLIKQ